MELAVTYCVVCLSGLSFVCPTQVIKHDISEPLSSDLPLLLCLLSAMLHVMLMFVSLPKTFSEKIKYFS